jgi:fatty acid synthase subunit alpha, fungi type
VLSAYYYALATLEQKGVSVPRAPIAALFQAAEKGEASIFALFGGQGTNEVYFDELQNLYDIYTPYVAPFVTTMVDQVLLPLAASQDSTNHYAYGLDVMSWLTGAVTRPPLSYLASIPISYPLIALTQLAQYLIVCRASNLTPGELRSRLSGTTGHSQGLGSAIAIAASTTPESFVENSAKMLKWSFYSALRGQEFFPVLALEPSIIKDAIEGGEGTPTPMLSVAGLLLKDLEIHVKKTNTHLPENSQLQISLFNAQKVFVVTGPPRALYGLVTSLRKVKAPSGLDQSKIPFSQRKPVFNMRFLVVNVPYHSHYLEGATKKLIEEDFGGEELWTPKDLGIPVYNTEDGM